MQFAVLRNLALKILDSIWLVKDFRPSVELEKRKNTLEYYLPRIRDDGERAEVLLELGRLECHLGNTVQAAGRYHECLRLFRKVKDRLGIGRTLYCIALLHLERGNMEKAEETLKECLQFAEECRNQWLTASCYSTMARLYFERGEYDKAIEMSLEAFDLFSETGDADGMGRTLQNACISLMKQGNVEKTVELLKNIRETWRGTNEENFILATLQLAAIHMSAGNVGEAEKLMEEIGDVQTVRISALANLLKALIYSTKGEKNEAMRLAEEAKKELKKAGMKPNIATEVLNAIRYLSSNP
ncbi:tetratricopeptide repeat protein [Archaeoglobus veneficus]|uniref:Tetratricopeptide TPR_1 repeat-containing protein n=1 Tax=Archaeoglobus veneficus (strain DSM 11195 / SNP6) TaxID=693661 RepID=F2KSW5_ARCVS|nr:tetratricopeptide repeat protein [Archaeoglobus veneficus]AEA47010.1 Tetratricopeptide TPR_1 repeat-containing protein [Archaeoglobus veneficus SNP6]